MIDVRLVNGQDQFALASFLVEIHPQDLVLRKGHLVEGIPDMAGLLRAQEAVPPRLSYRKPSYSGIPRPEMKSLNCLSSFGQIRRTSPVSTTR